MKKFNSAARITEIDELSDALIKLYANEAALQSEPYLKPVFTEMTDVSAKITEAIRKDKAFSDLEDADAARDEGAMRIFKITEGYTAMPMPAVSEPAERLRSILKKFMGLTRKPYNEESSLIESLLSDLSAETATADIAALSGLSESVENLRNLQSDFMQKRVLYNTATSEKKYEDTASTLKKPLLILINDRLAPYLTLMKIQDSAKYAHFADAVETAIEEANTKIKARMKKPEAKG